MLEESLRDSFEPETANGNGPALPRKCAFNERRCFLIRNFR